MTAGFRERGQSYGWVVMSITWLGNLVVMFVAFTLGILLPEIRDEFNLTPVQAGLLGSSFFLAAATFTLPSGLWLSRYSLRPITLLLLAGGSLLLLLQGWSPFFFVLLLGRFLFFLLSVGRVTSEVLLIHQWFEPRRIVLVNSFSLSIAGVGQAIGLVFVPFLLTMVGSWHNVYYLFGLCMLGVVLLWYFLGRERSSASSRMEGGGLLAPTRVLFRRPELWLVAFCQVGGAMAFSVFITFWPTFMVEERGFSLAQSGLLLSLYSLGGIAGSFASGIVSDLLRRRKPVIWFSGLVLPLLYWGFLLFSSPVVLAPILFSAGFFAFGVVPILVTIPYDMNLKPREIALAVSLIRTFMPLGGTLGPIMVGLVHQLSGSLSLGLAIAVPVPLTLLIGGLLIPETSPLRRGAAAPEGARA